MRLVSTKYIKPGAILGQTIFNENGVVLLQKGMYLSQNILHRLQRHGISYVYVVDKTTSDIQAKSVISDELRNTTTQTMRNIFTELNGSDVVKHSFILDKQQGKLASIVSQIVGEIQSHGESISMLADIFLSDDYILQHSLNVTVYSLAIGQAMNLNANQLSELGIGALLHDIGKGLIDKNILNKPGKLTDEEFEIMKTHTTMGYNILRKQQSISTVVAHCAYQHHERLNGSGYPRGIKGDQIHLYAKIIGVADVFDAVTSNRVYREAMLPNEGLEVLYAGAMDLFDKDMVEAFKNSIAIYPNGVSVQLSDNRIGVVVRQNKHLCDRPIIRILEDGKRGTPYEIDLSKELTVMITKCHI
ncbi:HD-GYP domain-containing protein [Ornithinibacillus halophilus]|uniref:HDIG domain-containing protein n=1 Tax=Ornithinibacillus halophilus TaxID=930117 RepID=A0A1M5JNX8_9BACI|nr:HD-GYP domain-containing protein [Ornithinibacillus halophilus]SHG41990.1 HDIG domain-containing protein [Ornithinibacillus halophilus]